MTITLTKPDPRFAVHHWDKAQCRHVDRECGCRVDDARAELTKIRKTVDASAYLVTRNGGRWVLYQPGGAR